MGRTVWSSHAKEVAKSLKKGDIGG